MSTIGERIKKVRISNDEYKTRKKFGETLGFSENYVYMLETDRTNITDRNIKDICKKFNISYAWLTEGKGEMYDSVDNEAQAIVDALMSGDNKVAKAVFVTLARQDEEFWENAVKFGREILEEYKRSQENPGEDS